MSKGKSVHRAQSQTADDLSFLSHIKPIKSADIPNTVKDGVIQQLPEFAELVQVAKHVAEKGLPSVEALEVANIAVIKQRDPEARQMKTLLASFVMQARRVLKRYHVDENLSLKVRQGIVYLDIVRR